LDNDYSKRQTLEVVLELEPLIDRDENVKQALGLGDQPGIG
jgi:hypothetical protein